MDESINKKNIDPEIQKTDTADSEEYKLEPEIANEDGYPGQTKDIVSDLRKKLKQAEEEKREYLLGWQKSKADYINSRKGDEEDNRKAIKYAESALLSELVPVLDSFDMAFSNKEEVEKLPDVWRKGVEQIRNQLMGVLSDHNLEIIDPKGKVFDPRDAEAIGVVETNNEKEDDLVITVLQKGYKLKDRVLRPAKVQVGKYSDTPKT